MSIWLPALFIGSVSYSEVSLNPAGFVSFGSCNSVDKIDCTAIIGPWIAQGNHRFLFGYNYYYTYSWYNYQILNFINRVVSSAYQGQFTASLAWVFEWKIFEFGYNSEQFAEVQLILASDGDLTFAIFYYPKNGLRWTADIDSTQSLRIWAGYNISDFYNTQGPQIISFFEARSENNVTKNTTLGITPFDLDDVKGNSGKFQNS